eukprot:8419014-Pyramimonas_sp.AAC.1
MARSPTFLSLPPPLRTSPRSSPPSSPPQISGDVSQNSRPRLINLGHKSLGTFARPQGNPEGAQDEGKRGQARI